MRSNAGMANRQGDVELRKSPSPVSTLAWLVLAWLGLDLVILHTYSSMKMEQSVPKRRHIKLRCRGITQKKAYNIQNTAKV